MEQEDPLPDSDCIDPSQFTIRLLRDQVSSGQGIVPFVGAGLSVPFGMPGWRKFLLDLARQCEDEIGIEEFLDEGAYEEVAEYIALQLAPQAFDDAIAGAFGDHAIIEPTCVTAVSYLPRLARPVITTNFDHVLERQFEAAGQRFERVVWGPRTPFIIDALQRDRRYLIKIHGDVDDPQDRVLTRADYETLYGESRSDGNPQRPLGHLLKRIFESRTMLFIGCSLTDDRVVGSLAEVADQPGAFSHYAIVPKPASQEATRERARFLSQRRIRPIWYPEGRHDLIAPFIASLLTPDGASGPAALSPLVPAAEFFQPLLHTAPGRLFHHDWVLVGRSTLIDDFHAWVDDQDPPIAILSGRGGIGKTRLLLAFAQDFGDRHPGVTVRFAVPGVPFTSDNLSSPTGPLVIVVDDAHHRDDLGILLAYAQQHRDRVKLLLTSRPYRLESLRSSLFKAHFDTREMKDFGNLTDLTLNETRELAAQALDAANQHLADRLANLTRDSPLVTVLGGQLLAERAVAPELLERDEEFRRVLLDRFQDVVTGDVSDLVDPAFIRRVLPVIAALSPIHPDEGQFLQAAAAFLTTTVGEVVQAIDALEAAGVLLRRGRTLRITPDVLSDHILYRACFRLDGNPTDFAQEVFDAFRAVYPKQVLESLAELDWRVRLAGGGSTVLLDGIWRSLNEELRLGSNQERYELLTRLEDVAYLQPNRVLDMVEFVQRNPAPDLANEEEQLFSIDTHAQVVEKLPSLLRRVGHNLDYLPRVCDLLWELGRDDTRSLSQTPDHAMRVLADFAEYDVGKPVAVNEIVLDAVEKWLRQRNAHAHLHSPFEVLDPLLAKTGVSNHAEGYRITFSPFLVSQETTAPLRQRVFANLDLALERDELKLTSRVLKSLLKALEPPRPRFNEIHTDEQIASWLPERLDALGIITRISQDATNPVVHLQVAEGLAWYIQVEQDAQVRATAAAIVASIPKEIGFLTLAALANEFDWWPHSEEAVGQSRYEQRQRRWGEAMQRCVDSFTTAYADPVDGAQALEDGLVLLIEHSMSPPPMMFLEAIAHTGGAYATGLAEYALEHPDSQLAGYLGTILWELRSIDRARATSLAKRALASGFLKLALSVAFWARASAKDADDDDLEIIKDLIEHPDARVRRPAIESLAWLGRFQPIVAADLALDAEIGTDPALAGAVCKVFVPHFGVDPAQLEDDDIALVLEKLRVVDSISDYHIEEFLACAAQRMPRRVLAMLLDRIFGDDRATRRDFRPLPFHGLESVFVGTTANPAYREMLKDIRSRSLEDSWQTTFWLPGLFKVASVEFSPEGLALIEEWATSNDPAQVRAAARLLIDAPSSFIFVHRDLVIRILDNAYRLGGDNYDEVVAHLTRSATSEVRSRTPGTGEAYPEDIQIQRQAADAMVGLKPGSPSYRFFAGLKAVAERNIRRVKLEDEEEFD